MLTLNVHNSNFSAVHVWNVTLYSLYTECNLLYLDLDCSRQKLLSARIFLQVYLETKRRVESLDAGCLKWVGSLRNYATKKLQSCRSPVLYTNEVTMGRAWIQVREERAVNMLVGKLSGEWPLWKQRDKYESVRINKACTEQSQDRVRLWAVTLVSVASQCIIYSETCLRYIL
jgi:hypothetical protein